MKQKHVIARFRIGDRCYCKHPYAFRGEQPFKIVSIAALDNPLRYIYVVQYDDKVLDSIPVKDEGGYEMEKVK